MKRFFEILLNFEPGEWVGADEWSIKLTGVPANSWAVLGMIVAAAGLIWLTVRSYLREGDVSRRAKLALAGVRITAILLVFLVLLRPVLKLTRARAEFTTVAVLIDTSESMSLQDPYVTLSQRAALAAKLDVPSTELAKMSRLGVARKLMTRKGGALARLAEDHPLVLMRFSPESSPDGSYIETLATWDKTDPYAVPTPPPPSETHVTVALAVAGAAGLYLTVLASLAVYAMLRRRSLPAGQEVAGPSTFLMISGAIAVLVACVAGTYAYNAHRARQDAATAREPVDDRPAIEVIRQAVGPLTAKGGRTDLVRAVRDAIGAEALRQRRVAALVVLSDGRPAPIADDGGGLAKIREYAAKRNIPLLSACIGDPLARPKNLRVASLEMERYVLRGSLAEAKVVLESRNCAGQRVTVKLYRRSAGPTGGEVRWQDTRVSAQVVLAEPPRRRGAGGAEPTLSRTEVGLSVLCPQSGESIYRAVVQPLRRELFTDDNDAHAYVTVRDKPTRVLLISGDAGWEFQYLRNYLLRARAVLGGGDGVPAKVVPRYLVSVWQQNADPEFNQDASTGMKLTALPRTAEEMFDAFDVIVLYDPTLTTGGFDTNFVTLLKEFVGVHGGGLAYIASGRNTGVNLHPERGGRETFRPLADLLPVVIGQRGLHVPEAIERMRQRSGHRVQLIGDGIGHPVTALHAEPAKNQTVWNILPGIFWSHPVARLKAGTSVLITSSYSGDRLSDPAARDAFPLAAVHRPGRGSVLYMGFDSTWRWRYVRGALYYKKFWSNVVDFLARDRLKKRQVSIAAVSEDTLLKITADVYDATYRPLDKPTYTVRIINTTTHRSKEATLLHAESKSKDTRKSPRFAGTVEGMAPGIYKVTAATNVPADTVADTVVTIAPSRVEFERPEADPATLTELSGRQAIPTEQFDQLAKALPAEDRGEPDEPATERDLWSVWLIVVVLSTLLFVEWIGRKKYNMT